LLIAESVLGISAETIARFDRTIALAESALASAAAGFGEVEAYPEFSAKAAVLCSRLVRNHPLPDGNKRTAYLCLREFVERNGYEWHPPKDAVEETVRIIEGLAAGTVSELELQAWIEERLA
jgi:death on curing protein